MRRTPGALAVFTALTLSAVTAWADGDEDLDTIYTMNVAGGGVATAGVGLSARFDGIRNMTGALDVTTVPAGATVVQAWLYWSIYGGTDDDPTFNGTAIVGTQIGMSANTAWSIPTGLYSYRHDVTSMVSGNGTYIIEGLQSSPLNFDANGAGLLIVYSDPASIQSATVTVSDGARTWCASPAFTEQFATFTVPTSPTAATFGVHVADGQPALVDSSMAFELLAVTPSFAAGDGGMWDRNEHDVLSVISAGANSPSWSYQADGVDCVQFVSAWLDVRWPDADHDLVPDDADNCPNVANPAQADGDGDGVGDACTGDMGAPDMDAGPADMDAAMPDMDAAIPDMDAATPDMDAAAPDMDAATPDMDAAAPDMDAAAPDMDAATPDMDAATADMDAAIDVDVAVDAPADMRPRPDASTDVALDARTDTSADADPRPIDKKSEEGCCRTAHGRSSGGGLVLLVVGAVGWRRRRWLSARCR